MKRPTFFKANFWIKCIKNTEIILMILQQIMPTYSEFAYNCDVYNQADLYVLDGNSIT